MFNLPQKLLGLGGTLGLVLTTTEQMVGIHGSLHERFWLIWFIALAALLAAVWPRRRPKAGFDVARKPNLASYRWVIAVCLAFLAVGALRYWEVRRSVSGPRPVVPTIPPALILPIALVNTPDLPTQVDLVSFRLQREKTSYTGTEKFFGPDPYVDPFEECRPYDIAYDDLDIDAVLALPGGDFPPLDIRRIRRALQRRAKTTDQRDLLKYIQSDKLVRTLVPRRPDIATRLIPRSEEWPLLSKQDYKDLLHWLRNCVGIFRPVFLVMIRNRATQPIYVTEVVYHVLEADQFKDSVPGAGPATPSAIYSHKIIPRATMQRRFLDKPFRIPKEDLGLFELEIDLETFGGGPWYVNLRVEFVTTVGSATTEDLTIFYGPK